jgi:hypothetical protein
VFCDDQGDGGLEAFPVFLVDPAGAGNAPLKIQSVIPTNKTGLNGSTSFGAAAVFPSRWYSQSTGSLFVDDQGLQSIRQASTANTANSTTLDMRQLAQSVAIQSDSTGGTSTLTVSGSVDNVNYLTLDSIVTAAVVTKQYFGQATVGATLALSPLSFRYIKIVAGAAGVGIVNTLTVAIK